MKASEKKELEKFVSLAQRRINKGVRYLDGKFGRTKWLKKIDEEVLNLNNSSTCVAGQLFGSFWNWVHSGENTNENIVAVPLGFYLEKEWEDYYDLLTRLWYIKITQLKLERGVELSF